MKTKMVEMNGQMVRVMVCAPSRRRATSSIQSRGSKMTPLRMDKKPGRDALSFVLPLVTQVQRHLSLIPIDKGELERRSALSATAFIAVLDYMVETKMANMDSDGVTFGSIVVR